MPNITKNDLVRHAASQNGCLLETSRNIFEAMLDSMRDAFKNNKCVELRGFGTFTPYMGAPRLGRNIKTGERVPVPARKTVKFKAHCREYIVKQPMQIEAIVCD